MKASSLIGGGLIMLGVGLILIVTSHPIANIESKTLSANQINFKFNDAEIHQKALFEELESIGFKVANETEYELHIYDCTNFSIELKKRLKAKGYNATCVFGELPNAEGYKLHTWIEINISNTLIQMEATQGYIIPEEYFKENYIVKSKGKCL